ncbi:MAG: dienelactone hydrolase family protein [Planctomycetota bacterium]
MTKRTDMAEMTEEFCRFQNEGSTLYGTLGLPDGKIGAGVVLIHGWSGCRMGPHKILVQMGRHLNRRGIATLRFDLRGRGESHGDPFAADLDGMMSDGEAALDYLKSKLPDEVALGLLGMCSGGNVALGILTERDDVNATVCWSTYPFQSQRQTRQDVRRTGHFLKTYVKKVFRRETWEKLLKGAINYRMIWQVLFGHYGDGDEERNARESVRDEQIVERLGKYEGDLFFLFGDRDPEGTDAREIFEKFTSETGVCAEFEGIRGANHNFYSLAWKRSAISHSGDWLVDKLKEA